ncbi:MAG: pyridoxal-phosphate dependent enzyme [Victivallales bacterium]|nr:pyridoxal-phosphate dependent enzyme [Victivallales bacterium]
MCEFSLKCSGCGLKPDFTNMLINSCGNRGIGDTDHILNSRINFTEQNYRGNIVSNKNNVSSNNPFIYFKDHFLSYHTARLYNVDFGEIINNIQKRLSATVKKEFSFTPVSIHNNISTLKNLIIKNETVNVSGSHKSRHLMGNILYLEVLRKAGILNYKPNLSVYSCGNAAIAAAIIANAAEYNLDVFIPPNLDHEVTDILIENNANIHECPRIKYEEGDPCYLRFMESIKKGAVPFSCSGPDNWANIEGGKTLMLEMIHQLTGFGKELDSVTIQVGGGALASSAVQALDELFKLKFISKLPEIYTVQTNSCFPLPRAYFLLAKKIASENGLKCSLKFEKKTDKAEAAEENNKILKYSEASLDEVLNISNFIKKNFNRRSVQKVLEEAAVNKRSSFIWEWETEPESIAHGILDDVTYDWYKLVKGMFKTGGIPVIVNENDLIYANVEGKKLTGIKADPTGTSGFAGLRKLLSLNPVSEDSNAGVIFTGIERNEI